MPEILKFPRITDDRGSLAYAQDLPFQIKRCYWIFDLSAEARRGGHAHRICHRILIPVSGSFIAAVDDVPYQLYKPWIGLWIKPGEWLDMHSFSGGASVLALASELYDESDYIRDRTPQQPDAALIRAERALHREPI